VNLRTVLYLIVAVTVTACNDSKTSPPAETLADSIKKVNAVYTDKLISLSGAKDMESLLCQGWELEDDLDAVHSSDESMGILPFRSYYLSPDFTFVKNPRNAMEYGRWQYDKEQKTITFSYSNGGKDIYKIAALAPDELVLVNTGIKSMTTLKFLAAGKRYREVADDPFHISNNKWRLHPQKPETDEQVKQRLKEYLHFNILFYRNNLAKEEKTITFYGLPTCLKWYAGGIYMVKEDKLNENWTYCFYNKDQAMKAYKMMEALLTGKYNWPKGKISWVNKNLSVLEQMYERL
jgi:hypothetical protein